MTFNVGEAYETAHFFAGSWAISLELLFGLRGTTTIPQAGNIGEGQEPKVSAMQHQDTTISVWSLRLKPTMGTPMYIMLAIKQQPAPMRQPSKRVCCVDGIRPAFSANRVT